MKKILFLTGTRADFGKIKPLIRILYEQSDFTPIICVTGMHLQKEYGYTLIDIQRSGFTHIHTIQNHTDEATMDLTLAKTIEGLSKLVKKYRLDMIVVHGDRPETLAGAIVGAFNNILVAHIEGGEVSGTVDELIRHAVSKLSHIHFTANSTAKKRLIQMGELPESVFIIGSPDIDIMLSDTLPSLQEVKQHYEIGFDTYAIALFHPVTTEVYLTQQYALDFTNALLEDKRNYILIYPNNDWGSKSIIKAYASLKNNSRFRIFPSLRFEYFLTLLKHAELIVGNSSAGIREAPYFGIPVINIGSRQNNRTDNPCILHVNHNKNDILNALRTCFTRHPPFSRINPKEFGEGKSSTQFLKILQQKDIWTINNQKHFRML